MSLQAEKKTFKSEMPTGVHLAYIHDMKTHRDANKQPIVKDGEIAILVTFCNGTNQFHEQIYWCGKGNAGKEKYFTQMCLDAMIDMSVTPMKVSAAKGKRLWIAIREVFTLVNNGEDVKKSDITGEAVIEKFIFRTAPIFDVEKQPTWKGDPLFNDGVACDEFVGYVEENEDGYETMPKGEPTPLTLEVKAVTPEIEKEVAVAEEKKSKKKKIEAVASNIPLMAQASQLDEEKGLIDRKLSEVISENKQVIDNSFKDIIVNGVAGVHVSEEGKATNISVEKAHELISSQSTTPAPNFGEATTTPTIESAMKNVDMSQMTIVQPQVATATPLPNFGDNETPDTNF